MRCIYPSRVMFAMNMCGKPRKHTYLQKYEILQIKSPTPFD